MLSSRVTLVAFSLAGGWQETAWGCVCVCGGGGGGGGGGGAAGGGGGGRSG